MTPQTLSAALAPVLADMPLRYFGDWQYGSVSIPTEAAELIAVGWLVRELRKHSPLMLPTDNHAQVTTFSMEKPWKPLDHTGPTDIEALVSALVAARGSK